MFVPLLHFFWMLEIELRSTVFMLSENCFSSANTFDRGVEGFDLEILSFGSDCFLLSVSKDTRSLNQDFSCFCYRRFGG